MSTIGSRLPRGVVLEGSVRGQGDLRVAGEILGPIEIDGHLVIEEGGVVRGEVRARTLTIAGTLEGNATALELVRLEPGARMTGDARAERVSAAQGALLKGRVRTSQERAQLERMRRTTGGTLLAPFSSAGGIAAPSMERSSPGEIAAPPIDRSLLARAPLDHAPAELEPSHERAPIQRPPVERPTLERLTTEDAVARVTRDAVIDGRDAASVAAYEAEHGMGRPTKPLPSKPASRPAPEGRAASETPPMDRPPPPVMPAIGRRRAMRRNRENAS